jgi:diadenosine tetraphosphate (Ap4A) HIT family hydrolase
MTEATSCLICERITQIQAGTNPWFVAEIETGYVVLGDYQFFRGYTLLLGRAHLPELHDLPRAERVLFLTEMSEVAEAVFRWVRPRKLNYELLGNAEPHLHWHLFPRHADDPSPGTSSWKVDRALRYSEVSRPTPEELQNLRQGLLTELRRQPDLRIMRTWED